MDKIIDFLTENPDYIISVFVLFFTIAGLQFKDMRLVLSCLTLANCLLAAQCIIGGTLSTGAVVILATVQSIICFILSAKKIKVPLWLTLLFIAGYCAITVVGFFNPSVKSSPFDFVSMVAVWFFALEAVQEKSWICRIFSVGNTGLWLIYDIAVLPSAVLNHAIILTTVIVGIIRNDRAEWASLIKRMRGKHRVDSEE